MPIQLGFSPLSQEPTAAVKLMAAGAGACTAELMTFPLDMAKVRLMVQGEGTNRGAKLRYHGVFQTISTVAKAEGITGLYSGLTAGLHRQLVIGSVRIGLYDTAKTFYAIRFDGHNDIYHTSILTRIAAGISTGVLSVILGQPTDVVKIRMQAQGATGIIRYSGAISAYGKIASQEGVLGLWKGLSPNAARTSVVNACEIVSYDLIKTAIVKHKLMTDNAPCHFLSAVCAGIITTAVSSPIDVVKTRFMNSKPGQYNGLVHCSTNMWKEGGIRTFYKGCIPSFLRLSLWNIIMFVTFEQMKRGMTHGIDNIQHLRVRQKAKAKSWAD